MLRFGLARDLRLTTSKPLDRPETLRFISAARSTPGSRRGNEDAHLATDWVVAVADGVGGRKAGRVAARTAIHYVARAENEQSAAQSVAAAHAAIRAHASTEPLLRGMATTLDVARLRVTDGQTVIDGVHVGDGFAIVQDTSGTHLMTRPDTAGQRLEELDPECAQQMRGDPDYDCIVAAVGFSGPLRPQHWKVPAAIGQRLLLASDGLLAAVSYEFVIDVMIRYRDHPVDAVADHLLRLGMDADDNVTIIVADLDVAVRLVAEDLCLDSPRRVETICTALYPKIWGARNAEAYKGDNYTYLCRYLMANNLLTREDVETAQALAERNHLTGASAKTAELFDIIKRHRRSLSVTRGGPGNG